jgi:hypothetical protein
LIKTTQVRVSDAARKERSMMMQGMALALQLATIAPFQAGAALQANGIFVTNTIKFTQPKMYSQLLRDSILEIALLYNYEDEIS